MPDAQIDYKQERTNDVNEILNSLHPRKVVVAGPGTGKSFLFQEIIKKKKAEGKKRFLAITFIGKLGDALADDLCGLAKTTTMHGFARGFVLEYCKGWNYYPRMYELIEEDLKADGITDFEVGDESYKRKTKQYQTVGDADVVHYAVQICKKDANKIPVFDLILIDEYQDFNATESALVDILAQKNEIVITGDDDQALYGFKGSSPSFIREKYDPDNTHWESRTLRFCSRCTEVMIKYFHAIVERYNLNDSTGSDPTTRRIRKEFICYMPSEEHDSKIYDSKANPKIHLIKNCPVGMIAYKVYSELKELVEVQKIKDVLIIGEGRSCKTLLKIIAQQLKNYGFKNIDYRDEADILQIQQDIVDAYKFIARDESSLLGWRILGNPTDEGEKEKHIKNSKTLKAIIDGTPSELEKIKGADIKTLESIIEDCKTQNEKVNAGDGESDETAIEAERYKQDEEIRKNVLIHELKQSNLFCRDLFVILILLYATS